MREAGGSKKWPLPSGIEGRATFSADGEYRYVLRREWDTSGPIATFVGLNPSTAEADVDDPTVRKCWKWASEWGYGSMVMLNLYAFRTTDPAVMRGVGLGHCIGPDNNAYLSALASEADLLVAAWGSGDAAQARHAFVFSLLTEHSKTGQVHTLGLTKGGYPRHPLYLPGAQKPIPFYERVRRAS